MAKTVTIPANLIPEIEEWGKLTNKLFGKTHRKPPIHRVEAGKHLMQLANVAAGALVFGQGFSGFSFNLRIAIIGVTVVVGLYVFALNLMKGGEGK